MNERSVVFRVVLLLVLAVPQAWAQLAPGDLEVGIDGGIISLDSAAGDDTEAIFGIRGGFMATPRFGFEIEYKIAEAPLDSDLSTWMGNVLYNFGSYGSLDPFAYAGFGLALLETEGVFGQPVDDKGLAWQGGVGARMFFGARFGVRFQAGALYENTFDAGSTHVVATAGLTVRLGR
ncbi:MAG TPA: outer membrane beta-barrel protein [Thermoanaerobaculia bacterium]|nr:outer membrane beta-barrel protein [Thermoanaerobaculia bacterium]